MGSLIHPVQPSPDPDPTLQGKRARARGLGYEVVVQRSLERAGYVVHRARASRGREIFSKKEGRTFTPSISNDLFGVFDIVALRRRPPFDPRYALSPPIDSLWIQVTTHNGAPGHKTKMRDFLRPFTVEPPLAVLLIAYPQERAGARQRWRAFAWAHHLGDFVADPYGLVPKLLGLDEWAPAPRKKKEG